MKFLVATPGVPGESVADIFAALPRLNQANYTIVKPMHA